MTNTKSTKRALLTSVLALFLCFTMLLGTTFAWFTDSVTSANNIIKSGNLDIELYHSDDKADRAKVDNTTVLFDDIALWEPGAVVYETLEVVNEGDLALKYQLSVNVTNATANANGNTLSNILRVGVIKGGATITDRVALIGAVDEWMSLSSFVEAGDLVNKNESDVYTVVIYWEPSEYDNDYNMNNGKGAPLTLDIGVTLFATQLAAEMDSFDENYDKDSAVATVAEAEAMMAENKDVTLAGCNEPDSVLNVPATYTGKLTLANTNVKSVQAEKDANIVVLGNVTVDANGSGIAIMALDTDAFDGSAISVNGVLNISGGGKLTAIAADVNGASGIGGKNATEINIEGVTIDYVSGSFAYGVGSDTKYYKDAPEGGAAIGSDIDGAVITLNNVIVNKAIGGSKAAGIGARFHKGVTVNIVDSAIAYVEGGVSAAGVGGSRVSNGATENGTTINISGSTINAKGGVYGAGIGSGYDTHCQSVQPLCTINIDDSIITAEGGQYAAGVGTGYHNAALDGVIKNSTVNAKSGEMWYKDSYTCAQNIGFGVVDPAREGQQTDSKLVNNGVEIRIPAPGKAAIVSSADELKAALASEIPNIFLSANIQLNENMDVLANTIINGNGYSVFRADGTALMTLSEDESSTIYTGAMFTVKSGATLTLENVVVDGGAIWTGEINEVLQRGTINAGVTATGALVSTDANAHLVLNEGTILQNNDGANAVFLNTRVGATLTINGGEIINNHSAAGAIWGGGAITLNAGKINGNHGGIGGAIRAVTNIGTLLTMNGGEMNHNYSDGNGGAIWAGSSSSNNVYVLNGGEMAYNYSATTGGAIYAGYYETVKIGGTFKMHDNSCAAAIGAEIRFHDHASLVMTGGEVSNEADNAFYLNNNSASITGGKYVGNFGYSGGLGLTLGEVEIDGVITYNLGTNHNTAYLAAEFGNFKFTVNETASNFAQFNFKPAEGYIYTEGDEAKLVCMNDGYETYWDASTSTFRLQAK